MRQDYTFFKNSNYPLKLNGLSRELIPCTRFEQTQEVSHDGITFVMSVDVKKVPIKTFNKG